MGAVYHGMKGVEGTTSHKTGAIFEGKWGTEGGGGLWRMFMPPPTPPTLDWQLGLLLLNFLRQINPMIFKGGTNIR